MGCLWMTIQRLQLMYIPLCCASVKEPVKLTVSHVNYFIQDNGITWPATVRELHHVVNKSQDSIQTSNSARQSD